MLKEVLSYLYYHLKEVLLLIVGLSISLVCLFTVDYLASCLRNTLDDELNSWGIDNYNLSIDSPVPFDLEPLKEKGLVSNYSHYLCEMKENTILKVDYDYFSLVNDSLSIGRFFNSYDQLHHNRLAIVGSNVKAKVGDNLLVDDDYYQVIGILKNGSYDLLVDKDDAIIIPYYGKKNEYLLKIDDEKLLRNYLEYSNVKYQLDGLSDLKQSFDLLMEMTAKILSGISFVSLVVSITGLSSLSYLSTIHRMNEWGIRKALGASKLQIYCQILLENGLISFIGWFCGFILSLIVIGIISISFDLAFILNFGVIIKSSLVTIASGLASGLLPAAKAMKLAVSQCLDA